VTARDTARQAHERFFAEVLELDVDTCANTYGSAPCTAAAGTGNECYNSFGTCQDRTNYTRAVRTLKFCSRSMAAPAGETLRPYLTDFNGSATEIVPDKGLAIRGQSTATLIDEPCSDVGEDPYIANRATVATGTFWGRFIARNYNLVGRDARILRGYLTTPFDWATFETELYVITDVAGPDKQGKIKLTLNDPVKRLDAVKIPSVTDGKLATALPATANIGVATAATSTSITLAAAASAVDDAYNGQEVYVYEGTAAGQRRTITDYVGSTRIATVAAWAVNPDSTSSYEVGALGLSLATGKGAQYADPATSGKNEYVRLGDEVIRYTAKSGDTLTWPDTTYRAQFGTTRADHKLDANVQQCRAWIAKTVPEVAEDLLNEGGLVDGIIDLAQLSSEGTQWFNGVTLTACVPSPETASALLADLLIDLNASVWWDAIAQLVKFKANMPELGSAGALTDDNFILNSMDVKRASKDRITQAAIYYDLRAATLDTKKPESYGRAALYIDTDAESVNEYGDERPLIRYSRWLSEDNVNFASSWSARLIGRRRDAPINYSFKLDPKDLVGLGTLVEISTDSLQDATGAPAVKIARITKVEDQGEFQDVSALGTNFTTRYGFIAPNGQANYGSATSTEKQYAYICNTATGKMTNGDAGYRII
jgi:hypothetical protein